MKLISLLFLGILFSNVSLGQQQRQYSQYLYSLFAVNPAYAGNKDYIQTLITERKQWTGVIGSPHTQSLLIHAPFSNQKMGLGLNFLNETVGAHGMTNAMLSYSYSIVSSESRLSFGIRGGFTSFRLIKDNLTYRESNDPNSLDFLQSNFTPIFDAGMHYYRKRLQIGFSVSNLIESKANLVSDNIESAILKRHLNAYISYKFRMNDKWNFIPSMFLKTVVTAPLNSDFTLSLSKSDKLFFGVTYRTNSSIIGLFQLYITNNIRIGYSYDYYMRFTTFSGSHEFVLGVDFNKKNKAIVSPRYL
jgi:type IX secretion system PorP/SprF family membrane protein